MDSPVSSRYGLNEPDACNPMMRAKSVAAASMSRAASASALAASIGRTQL
ncbi:MAG: hypothetical protein HOV97_23855 [Nonomuraea sp.]|nr:hypothetical protein [Nonomuraea sp.]